MCRQEHQAIDARHHVKCATLEGREVLCIHLGSPVAPQNPPIVTESTTAGVGEEVNMRLLCFHGFPTIIA